MRKIINTIELSDDYTNCINIKIRASNRKKIKIWIYMIMTKDITSVVKASVVNDSAVENNAVTAKYVKDSVVKDNTVKDSLRKHPVALPNIA